MITRVTLARLALVACSVGLSLGFVETWIRIARSGDNLYATAALSVYAPDPTLHWTLRPNVRQSMFWAGRDVEIRTDEHGHRVPSIVRSESGSEMAFAGDSYVFGNEVNAEDTFVARVGAASRIGAVNLGVGGYAPKQEAGALIRHLARHPGTRLAFLVLYIGNDIEYGVDPGVSERVSDDGELLSGTGPGSVREQIKTVALRHSRLAFLIYRRWQSFRWTRTEHGHVSAANDTKSRWIYDESAFRPERLEDHRAVLANVRDAAAAAHVPLIVVIMPERDQVEGRLSDLPDRRLMTLLDDLDIPVVDLLPELRERARHGAQLFNQVPEGHLSPLGHAVVADLLSSSAATRSSETIE